MIRPFLVALLVAVSVLAAAKVALGHDWYPPACCSGIDCQPVPVEDVTLVDGRYVVAWGGQSIAFDEARPSPDGQYHICTTRGDPGGSLIDNRRVDGVVGPCFWAPQGF